MEPDKPAMSQKEYLKRYLMKDKKPKVKKKKSNISSSSHLKRSVIIDDDINIDDIPRVVDDTFSLDHLGDEAPQIAGIIDERPEEIKLEEKYKSGEWKPLKPESTYGSEEQIPDFGKKFSRQVQGDDSSPLRKTNQKKDRDRAELMEKSDNVRSYRERSSDGSDLSPPRPNRRREYVETRNDGRKSKYGRRPAREDQSVDSDLSPPRANRSRENSSISGKAEEKRRPKSSDGRSSKREVQDSDSDLSPPRGNRKDGDSERRDGKKYKPGGGEDKWKYKYSKSFGKKEKSDDSDLSPPRMNMRVDSERRGSKKSSRWNEPERHRKQERASDGSESDLNVPKKKKSNGEKEGDRRRRHSPALRQRPNNSDQDSDLSPPRRNRPQDHTRSDSRKTGKTGRGGSSSDLSPPRKKGGFDSDLSPPRKSRRDGDKRSRVENVDQMHDGKRAGLQDAKSLKDELQTLKEKEDAMFREMDPELLGRSTATVIRDRKTGLKRNFEKERQIEREKLAKNAVRQQKYDKWGKGLKQVKEQEEKVADMMHEMSKPLARYADDDDLERALKAQEREGDPMLEYIRSHQKDAHSIDLTVGGIRKKYMGSFMPNRFNVAPGHRWDGVDRSNGYEQKWFEARNAKKATAEEAWKWSSADM